MTSPLKTPPRTLGPHHDTFWEWCGKGQLRLQRCTSCGAMPWPVVQTCEACGHGEFEWQAMSGQGTVIGWTTFERDYYYGLLPMPWDTILVELAEGPLFLAIPSGFSWQEAQAGLPVLLAFRPAEDAAGPYQLPVFERA
ncbi:MAG: hypothetical protein KGN34_07370 [Sphingomonadales bacterium]|nr:hypothetical protein [Sphingomonadales bacterium]